MFVRAGERARAALRSRAIERRGIALRDAAEPRALRRRARAELEARAAGVFDGLSTGTLRQTIGRRYALAEAASAHRDLEGRSTTGKLLLVV